VPPSFWMVTSTEPVFPDGVIAEIIVALSITTLAAALVPKRTAELAAKLVPMIVTRVPPPADPEAGVIDRMVGGRFGGTVVVVVVGRVVVVVETAVVVVVDGRVVVVEVVVVVGRVVVVEIVVVVVGRVVVVEIVVVVVGRVVEVVVVTIVVVGPPAGSMIAGVA